MKRDRCELCQGQTDTIGLCYNQRCRNYRGHPTLQPSIESKITQPAMKQSVTEFLNSIIHLPYKEQTDAIGLFLIGQEEALSLATANLTHADEKIAELQGFIKKQVSLTALREANVARQAEWCPDPNEQPDMSFRAIELAGETGEACNVVKKLERERHNWRGSRDTVEHLAEELADVVISADLLAVTAGIDLQAAVIAKFNATSDKQGLATRLPNEPLCFYCKQPGGNHTPSCPKLKP